MRRRFVGCIRSSVGVLAKRAGEEGRARRVFPRRRHLGIGVPSVAAGLLAVLVTSCWGTPTEGPWRGAGAWWYSASGGASGTPFVDDELVVFGQSESDTVVALDRTTGDRVWARRLDLPLDGLGDPYLPPSMDIVGHEGLLILAARVLVALDRSTGDVVWSLGPAETMDFPGRSIALADDRLFAVGRELYAVDPGSGTVLWSRDYGEVLGRPLYEDGVLYAGGNGWVGSGGGGLQPLGAGHIRAIHAESGDVIWEHFAPDHPTAPWIGGVTERGLLTPELFIVSSRNAFVYAFEKETGEVRWTHEAPRPTSFGQGVALAGDVLVVGLSGAGEVRGLELGSGELLWTVPMGSSVLDVGSLGDLAVAVNGRMTAFDRNGREVWGFGGAGWGQPIFMHRPAMQGDLLFATSVMTGVHALWAP